MASPKPHAVVVPWPGQGHINPLMDFSKKLSSNGFTITFVNTEYNHVRVLQSQSLEPRPLAAQDASGLDIRFVGLPDGLPPDHGRTSDVPELCKAVTSMATVFEELIERLVHESPPITCIISDIFVLHTQDAANKYGIPRLAFWTQSAASYAAHQIVANGYRPPIGSGEDRNVITCVPGAPPLRLGDMPTFLQTYDSSDFMFDFVTRPFLRIGEASWIVINTFEDLEQTAMDALRKEHQSYLHTVGPLLPADFFTGSLKTTNGTALWPENYDCLKWLDTQPPSSVLYIAFGSIAVLSGQEIEEFALGLESSGLPFLWVLRPGLIVGGHTAILPEGYLDRMKNRALIIKWAPQLHVLSHPSVGGFLTHGGWNSTLEGTAGGHPMLGYPYFADQMLDCRCIADEWKNGLAFDPDESGVVSRWEVEKKVRALMEGKKIRERARHLRDEARRAMAEGGTSYTNLRDLMKDIRKIALPALKG